MTNAIQMEPVDEWNVKLIENVHPPTWKNPVPDGPYNLVVLGAGTGGLITALIASSLGAKVALIFRLSHRVKLGCVLSVCL